MLANRNMQILSIFRRFNRFFSTMPDSNLNLNTKSSVKRRPSFLYVGFTRTPFTVEPDLDFRHRFENFQELEENLKNRSILMTSSFLPMMSSASSSTTSSSPDASIIDFLNELRSRYYDVIDVYKRYQTLNKEIDRLSDEKSIDQPGNDGEEKIVDRLVALKSQQSELYEYLKLNRSIFLDCLRLLPNRLDADTPVGDRNLLIDDHVTSSPGDRSIKCDHMQLLSKNRLIDFQPDPDRLYLLDELADCQKILTDFFYKRFSTNRLNFIKCSPPNFVRSALIEALDLDFSHINLHKLSASDENLAPKLSKEDATDDVTSKDSAVKDDGLSPTNRVVEDDVTQFSPPHLIGHSVIAYLALFVERSFSKNTKFPLNFCSIGPSYKFKALNGAGDSSDWSKRAAESHDKVESRDVGDSDWSKTRDSSSVLLNHYQRPVVSLFTLADCQTDLKRMESVLKNEIDQCLINFDVNYRSFRVASKNLTRSEMSRVEFSIDFFNGKSNDIPGKSIVVAQILNYGDFLSRRLRIVQDGDSAATNSVKAKDSAYKYLHILYTEIDIYTLMAALIEHYYSNDQKKFDLSTLEKVIQKMPS